MPRELAPCGTVAAYRRHLKRGEPPCDACKKASAAARRAAPSYGALGHGRRGPLQPCGTRAGYERHRQRGEPICTACRTANAQAAAERRASALPQAFAHGASGYFNYACRCDVCLEGGREANRDARAKRKKATATTQGGA